MVSLPDPRDFGNGGCSVRCCLQSARLKHHTSPLKPSCCLQKINLNVFLSIYKSMRLCPVIIIYFYVLRRTKPGLTLAHMGFTVTLKPHMPQACSIPPASVSQGLVTGVGHRMWFAFTYTFFFGFIVLCFSFFYFLPFIFISSVLAISLLIKRNFLYSNKNKLKPNLLILKHLS